MKIFLNLFVWLCANLKIFGCNHLVLIVKRGVFGFDKSRTIGSAFDSYTYFEKTLWTELLSQSDEKVVQVEGIVDIDFLVLDEAYKAILKSIKIIVQFYVCADKSVGLHYMGIETTKRNGETTRYDILEHEMMLCMQDIYNNKPLK